MCIYLSVYLKTVEWVTETAMLTSVVCASDLCSGCVTMRMLPSSLTVIMFVTGRHCCGHRLVHHLQPQPWHRVLRLCRRHQLRWHAIHLRPALRRTLAPYVICVFPRCSCLCCAPTTHSRTRFSRLECFWVCFVPSYPPPCESTSVSCSHSLHICSCPLFLTSALLLFSFSSLLPPQRSLARRPPSC